jgi:hypothetical protein
MPTHSEMLIDVNDVDEVSALLPSQFWSCPTTRFERHPSSARDWPLVDAAALPMTAFRVAPRTSLLNGPKGANKVGGNLGKPRDNDDEGAVGAKERHRSMGLVPGHLQVSIRPGLEHERNSAPDPAQPTQRSQRVL